MRITIEGTARQAGARRTHAAKGHLRPRETRPALWLLCGGCCVASLWGYHRLARSRHVSLGFAVPLNVASMPHAASFRQALRRTAVNMTRI